MLYSGCVERSLVIWETIDEVLLADGWTFQRHIDHIRINSKIV